MPQASDKQRALMAKWFPLNRFGELNSGVDDGPPTEFLLARGWTEKGGLWHKPTPSHSASPYEYECLMFLVDEWDHAFEGSMFYNPYEELTS